MTRSISLLFGVHAHQPPGNFPEVVDEAHQKSYGPFFRTVYEYPEFRYAVHFSGWLLEYLLDHFPDDMALLRTMVERGQAELLGGGDMEPVLASIPARDRVGQINALSKRLERAFGKRPRGAWLTERVWESSVVPSLAEANIEFVTVDDYHFVCAGKTLTELTGYFTTEEDHDHLDLFPISEQLRYRLPFSPAAEAVAYLESLAVESGNAASIYFDDIEKFGIWPETYEWVFEKQWLKQFIEGVLASPHIQTQHFSEYRSQHRTRGIVYLPTTSYMEMGEWSLPAQRADDFDALITQQKSAGQYDRFKPFLRGGIWRNFLTRYPEANWMHKRMLALSDRVNALPGTQRSDIIIDLLYRAQANDAYWHGLFGGLYLPHLRRSVWNAITALERELAMIDSQPEQEVRDLDCDGHDEFFLRSPLMQAVVRNDEHAAVVELSSYPLSQNFLDTLTRRPEHYYRKFAASAQEGHATTEGIASAHDRVTFKHEIRPEDIVADARPRAAFLDAFTAENGNETRALQYALPASASATYVATMPMCTVTKSYSVETDRLIVRYRIETAEAGILRTEINLAMPSCDGFLGRAVFRGNVIGGFGETHAIPSAESLRLEDGVLCGAITAEFSPACKLLSQPMHTVSQSEAGFEKIMQAVTLTAEWRVGRGISTITAVLRPEKT